MMEEASVSIRLNPFKGLAGPEGTPVPWSPYGRILADRPVFTLDPLFHAGCYYVQDSSAMFVGHCFRNALYCTMKGAPPPATPRGLKALSDFRYAKVPGPAGPLMRTSLHSICPGAASSGRAKPEIWPSWLSRSEVTASPAALT